MPGAYAHITLVNLAKEPLRLEAAGMPLDAIKAPLKYLGVCELGAVSPDYPYLHIGRTGSKRWADLMHYEKTGEPIKKGIELVRDLSGEKQLKALAWLLGYAAHVVTDVTIHPVVEMRVGPYAANAQEHRICEMHQDVFIFPQLQLGDIGISEHLDTGIGACRDEQDKERLDPVIAGIWGAVLAHCHPEDYADNEPDLDAWHRGFKSSVDLAEEGNRLPLFARHVAVDCGLTYPAKPAKSYIEGLATPEGPMNYDAVFKRALANVVAMWTLVGKAVFEGNTEYQSAIQNWDLDTGKDKAGRYGYWSEGVMAGHT
jgi:hypothetical protein